MENIIVEEGGSVERLLFSEVFIASNYSSHSSSTLVDGNGLRLVILGHV